MQENDLPVIPLGTDACFHGKLYEIFKILQISEPANDDYYDTE